MRTALFVLGVAVFTPTAARPQQPEPKYDGRPLAYWIDRFQKAETDELRAKAVQAVCAFGRDGAPAVPALLVMLDDRSPSYRALVVEMLCAIGPGAKAAVPQLVQMLEEKSPRDAAAVIRVLCSIGPDAKPGLPAVRRVVLDAYARSGKKDTVAAEPPVWVIDYSIRKLPLVGPDAVPLLLDVLETGYGMETAVRLLKEMKYDEKQLARRVRGLLKHVAPGVRLDAARYVWAEERDAAVVPVLTELLAAVDDDPANELAQRAADALGDIGPPARDALPALTRIVQANAWMRGDDLPPAPTRLQYHAYIAIERIAPTPKKD